MHEIKELAQALQDMVLQSRLSAEQIAEAAFGFTDEGRPRKRHFTLYREIDPDDTGAKLGAIDALRIMMVTGDIRPLEIMVRSMGYVIKPKNYAIPDKATWEQEVVDGAIVHGKLDALMSTGASPDEVDAMAEQCKDEADQIKAAYKRGYIKGHVMRGGKWEDVAVETERNRR